MKKAGILLMAALLALAFLPVAHGYAQGKVVRITLIDENGSGEDGSAQITDQGDGTTKVELIMMNAPEGAVQPASVHEGTCTSVDADTAYDLGSVNEGKVTTSIKTSLEDLTKDKHVIVVYKSPSDKTVISCGNLPTNVNSNPSQMTLPQVMSQLLDEANELLGNIKNKETDASKNAYIIFHSDFAAHEDAIKAQDAEGWEHIETAMNETNDALGKGNFDEAVDHAQELINELKDVQGGLNSSTSNSTSGSGTGTMTLSAALTELQSQANDLIRETGNSDKDGAEAAYNDFHITFAANEDQIKAQDAEGWQHIETAMNEVNNALDEGNFTEANTAAKELLNEINDVIGGMGMGGSVSNDLPTSGMPISPLVPLGLGLAAAGLLFIGGRLRRHTAR